MSALLNSFGSYFTHLRGSVQLKLHRRGNKEGPLIFSESIPSVDISNTGHFLIAMFYVVVVIVFSSLEVVQFVNRSETTTRVLTPAELLPPLLVDVQLSCSNPPNCGAMTFAASYSGTSRFESCDLSQMKVFNNGTKTLDVVATNVPLCYFGEPVFSTYTTGALTVAGIVADFAGINPGYNKSNGTNVWQKNLRAQGIIKVFRAGTFDVSSGTMIGDTNSSSPQLIRVVNLDSWQVKSLVLSSILNKVAGTAAANPDVDGKIFPWDVAVQYEGRRPNWRANLIIFHAAYGTVLTRTRSPDYKFIDVTMEIVGFTFLFTMGLQYLTRPWKWLFPGPGATKNVEEAEKEVAKELEEDRKIAEMAAAEVSDVPIGRSTDDLASLHYRNSDHDVNLSDVEAHQNKNQVHGENEDQKSGVEL